MSSIPKYPAHFAKFNKKIKKSSSDASMTVTGHHRASLLTIDDFVVYLVSLFFYRKDVKIKLISFHRSCSFLLHECTVHEETKNHMDCCYCCKRPVQGGSMFSYLEHTFKNCVLQAKVEKDGYREEKKGIQQELPKSGGVGRAVWKVSLV